MLPKKRHWHDDWNCAGKGTAKDVAAACVLEHGLLVLTAKTLVRLLPPLTITFEEIDKGLAILEKVIKQA